MLPVINTESEQKEVLQVRNIFALARYKSSYMIVSNTCVMQIQVKSMIYANIYKPNRKFKPRRYNRIYTNKSGSIRMVLCETSYLDFAHTHCKLPTKP